MIEIRPFRALHYDPAVVGDLAAVVAPPYDVIDDALLASLYERSRHNVVRLILNREADRYAAAAAELADWRAKGVLTRDREACLYFYVQDFTLPGGARKRRGGLIAAVRLEPFSSGNIRPHERTFARAKEDRLRLLRSCRANLSPLFALYTDRLDALAAARRRSEAAPPWIDVTVDGGDRHRVWRVSDPAEIRSLQEGLADASLVIADGHHRYETALAHRDERRAAGENEPEAPHNFVLMYLTSMEEPGLVVLPTHRVWRGPAAAADVILGRLETAFEVVSVDPAGLAARMEAESALCLGLRLAGREGALLLRLRDPRALDETLAGLSPLVRRLDVTVLDAFVLRGLLDIDCTKAAQEGLLTYTHDDGEALASVREGARLAFLLRRPRMSDIEAVCSAGQTMPEKSTYFYPKLESGLVFHLLDE